MDDVSAACAPLYDALLNICVWNKSNAGMGSLYRSKHEMVFVFKAGSGPHINNFGLYGTPQRDVVIDLNDEPVKHVIVVANQTATGGALLEALDRSGAPPEPANSSEEKSRFSRPGVLAMAIHMVGTPGNAVARFTSTPWAARFAASLSTEET